MTNKERCDKCEFYEGPPQSDEKGITGEIFYGRLPCDSALLSIP